MQLPVDTNEAAFQGILDSVPGGESIDCLPHEYRGPLFFKNEVVVEGRGATFWALEGPVVIVASSGVILKDVRIEVTADQPRSGDGKDCALVVQPGADVRLENVEVRGGVQGLKTEEGTWQYPYSLNLDSMIPGERYEFLMRLIVPVQCQISSQVSGIDVVPAILAPGRNEVRVKVSSLPKDSLVNGSLYLRTALLKRRISLVGRVLSSATDARSSTAVSESVIWSPTDWDSTQGAPASRPPPVPSEPAKPSPEPPAPAPVTEMISRSEPSVITPSAPPTPISTRIRKQSTPLSSVWSAPIPVSEAKTDATSKPVVSDAFRQPSAPASTETSPQVKQSGLTPQGPVIPVAPKLPKSKPINIGIFAEGKSASQRDSNTPSETRQQTDPDQSRKQRDKDEPGTKAIEPDKPSQDESDSTRKPKQSPKKTGPSIPNIFIKP